MARINYSYEKRQRELAKKKKKEEKRQQKSLAKNERKRDPGDGTTGEGTKDDSRSE